MQFKVGEINIICSNLEASLTFYRDILGFTPTQDEDGYYHMLCGGRQYLLLPTANKSLPTDEYETVAQFSMDLYVDDLEAAYQYFQKHNVDFAMEWKVGASMFVIRDPNGLHWEVVKS